MVVAPVEQGLHERFEIANLHMVVPDRPRPNGQVGTIVTAILAPAGAQLASLAQSILGDEVLQTPINEVATAKCTMADVDAMGGFI
jgi:hypothetical protein